MTHFEHGAIDKSTQQLVDPEKALRRTWYECPDCHRDVHLRKGEKRAAYFAHRPDRENPCTYYTRNPSLDQQHKNAQLKLKHFLDNQVEIDIKRNCICGCGWITGTIVPLGHPGKGKCEHRFKFNDSQKSADVALVDGETIVSIFEVVHTHYTQERDRPEPWFEISAKEINSIPSDAARVNLTCIRQLQSKECIIETANRKEAERIEQEKKWKEEIVRREHEAKERDAFRARMIEQWNAEEKKRQEIRKLEMEKEKKQQEIRKLEMEKEMREKRRIALEKEKERKENESKALERKRELQRQFKLLYKKHSVTVPRCHQCSRLVGWLTADLWVGRCRNCESQINFLAHNEMKS